MQEEYQEIDLIEIIKTVLAKWWLIVIMMVAFGYGAYYYTTNYVTPIYRASTTLFIGREEGTIGGFSMSDLSVGGQLIGDYTQLIRTDLVLGEVIESLGLNMSTGTLNARLSIRVINDSRFVALYYQDPIPERAVIVVNRLSEVLADKADEIIGVKKFSVVDYAVTPRYPISPNVNRNVMMASMFGGAVAVGFIFLLILLDNTVKNEQEVEKLLKVPVLGSIPKFKGANRS